MLAKVGEQFVVLDQALVEPDAVVFIKRRDYFLVRHRLGLAHGTNGTASQPSRFPQSQRAERIGWQESENDAHLCISSMRAGICPVPVSWTALCLCGDD